MTGAVCVCNGGQLSQMTVTTQVETDGQTTTQTHTVDLTYDASGNPQTMTYDGVTYYYTVNIQGDVSGIVDENGNVLVRYNYQGYGATYYYDVPINSVGPTLRQINPLTYRGYVYDKETKLNYLQSRYYNRTTGRFLNADALVTTGQGLLGNNMFAYCLNNPVRFKDNSGEIPTDLIVGGATGGLAALISALIEGAPLDETIIKTLYGVFVGMVVAKNPKLAIVFSSIEVFATLLDCIYMGLPVEKTLQILAFKIGGELALPKTGDELVDTTVDATFGLSKDLIVEAIVLLIESCGGKYTTPEKAVYVISSCLAAGSGGGCMGAEKIDFGLDGVGYE